MGKIQARLIIEILGRPPEHVKKALEELINKLSTDKGVKILEKTLHDPLPLENSKDLFTSFAEVLLEFDSLANYVTTIFTYMPSNIEIIRPEELNIRNLDLSELGNTVLQRLHHYDAIVKGMLNERAALVAKLKEVAPHLFQKQSQQPITKTEAEESKQKATKSTKKAARKAKTKKE